MNGRMKIRHITSNLTLNPSPLGEGLISNSDTAPEGAVFFLHLQEHLLLIQYI